jgi:hypothetical protein
VAKRRAARKTNAEIKEIVDGFEPSELTQAAYAELHGITVAALDGYRRRLRMRSGGFVEIAVSGEPSVRRVTDGCDGAAGHGAERVDRDADADVGV